MLAPITHIRPLTLVRRTRQLPAEGNVAVRQGQRVRATDVVATATLEPRHRIINIAQALGVSRSEADQYIERDMREKLEEGDVIAKKAGLFNRVIRSPVAGRIVLITGGLVMIEEKVEPFTLRAGIPGEVARLVHNLGAVIEMSGALLQCVWGNGQIDSGHLSVLASEPGEPLRPERLDVSLRGAVVMGGYCDDLDVFHAAEENRIRGLIFGSMDSKLIPQVGGFPFPVVVTEGFSKQQMSDKAFKLLRSYDEQDLSVNAEPYNPETGEKPEILIPMAGAENEEPLPEVALLAPGTKVRIIRAPYRGWEATIAEILPGRPALFGSMKAQAAKVALGDGNTVRVPLANLEILS